MRRRAFRWSVACCQLRRAAGRQGRPILQRMILRGVVWRAGLFVGGLERRLLFDGSGGKMLDLRFMQVFVSAKLFGYCDCHSKMIDDRIISFSIL